MSTDTSTEPEILTADDLAINPAADQVDQAPADPAPVAETPPVELSEVEILRLTNERLQTELSAAHRQVADLKEIAESAEAKRKVWEDYKEAAKDAKEEYDAELEALAARARGDVQTTISEVDEQDEGPTDDEVDDAAAEAKAAPMPPNGGEAIEVIGIDWSKVKQSALSQLASTGKPQKIEPIEIMMGLFVVLTDVQERVAIMNRVLDKEQFGKLYPTLVWYDLPSSQRDAHPDDLIGMPVKVGRKVRWLGSNADAWRVQIPPNAAIDPMPVAAEPEEAAPEASADDALQLPLADRMAATLRTYPTTSMGRVCGWIDALANDLKVDRQEIIDAAVNAPHRFTADVIDGMPVVVLLDE